MKFIRFLLLPVLLALLLCGCGQQTAAQTVTVLFEDNGDILFRNQIFDVPRGTGLTATVSIPAGQRIASVSYPGSLVSPCTLDTGTRREYQLTLPAVSYPAIVRLTLAPDLTTTYDIGTGEPLTVTETSQRLRVNTLPWQQDFARPGFYPLGWQNTQTREVIGFGSRFDHRSTQSVTLECAWMPCTDASSFDYAITEDGAVITGCHGTGDIILPDALDGQPVIGIAARAFGRVDCDTLALPATLQFVEPGAFEALTVKHLYLFDTLTQISDDAFGSLTLSHLHIHAARAPVYCGTYFDTLSEKIDYLDSMKDARKLILFCGSSARFGYNSPMLEEAFPGYTVVNLGVYAYANMLPQAMLLEQYLRPGDVVLSSPELDAIDMQFCGSNRLDKETFAMMESNYCLLAEIDLSGFTGIFDAFRDYQRSRSGMSPRSYDDIPAHYDEDNQPAPTLSYNRQGDYILHRPSNTDQKLFGIKRAFYNPSHIREEDWQGLNSVYDCFTAQGAQVFFTYSPRSARSISPDSDTSSIRALDEALRQRLHVPVISSIEDSLMDAFYFYGTDNHLTTEGAEIHTQAVIEDLKNVLQ